MTEHKLDECLNSIKKIFSETKNKYECHLKCYPILHRMSENDDIIFEVFRRNLTNKNFLNKKHCTPDLGLTLMDEPECFMFVNFFGPNKEKRTDISYSTMHHHDDYLLSTINAKGEGYTSLIFQQGYDIDRENNTAKIELEKYVLHAPRHIEFINCHTNHCIFYPKSMTMTYGLWSNFYSTSRSSKIKNSKFVQKNKNGIRKIMNALNFSPESLGVAQYREDYFYPENGQIRFLPGQVLPENGNHFVQNVFNIAQQFLSFDDLSFLKKLHKAKKGTEEDGQLEWIEKAIENETIERNYDSYNMYVDMRNVHMDEYKKVYNI